MKKVTLMYWIIILLLFLTPACSNPRNTQLPTDISKIESIKPQIDKLSSEERELLTAFLMRHTVGAAFGAAFGMKVDPIPEGMTIGKAIEEQRDFVKKQKTDQAAKKAAEEKAEVERKALITQMNQVLAVRLAGIDLHKATYQDFDVENYIKLAIEFNNKGSKMITGLKGVAIFKDKFGDTVSELPIKVEEQLPPGKSKIVRLAKKYNQFNAEDQRLASVDADSVSFAVAPEIILFDDGSKFEAPKAK